jgi:hypothetical protein
VIKKGRRAGNSAVKKLRVAVNTDAEYFPKFHI